MTDTPGDTASAPRSEYDDLLEFSYTGEIFGAALFGAMAEAQPDPERREKLETLQTVEARTATSLRRLVANAALRPDIDQPHRDGLELSAKIEPENWHGFVRGLRDALPEFLAKFERLREIAPVPTDPALVALVNHERAIQEFAELELSDGSEQSLKPLQQYLRRPA